MLGAPNKRLTWRKRTGVLRTGVLRTYVWGTGVRGTGVRVQVFGGGGNICSGVDPLGEQMFVTGGLPKHPCRYIYITLCRDVWFLLLTVSGVLVCFVTVGGHVTGCRVSPHVLHMSVWVAGLVLVDTCRL